MFKFDVNSNVLLMVLPFLKFKDCASFFVFVFSITKALILKGFSFWLGFLIVHHSLRGLVMSNSQGIRYTEDEIKALGGQITYTGGHKRIESYQPMQIPLMLTTPLAHKLKEV